MPVKFARPLTGRLKKESWEKEHVADRQLLFAIQDFSFPAYMTKTSSALHRYHQYSVGRPSWFAVWQALEG
ncbi:hypothetical protein EN836_27995 [Mesorhizobium sp. M1C.F.Ca.ET.193.01.1.1]|uniref:hypothetical protein n=1 Tax=unclassified Mesorhizobium TaxID=325217 RepID=UPI000FD4A4CF|nr:MULTISPECIES: hypothetical protein [unclassified Mesorhizobium]TGS93435.1 hypothetical protein EN820_48655 [bacterium M00.F.Ca.ET.177.01.1.1]TGQ50723.1 hypothetical protein EN853_27985 [Mesorhizobium sp. M1C.F.Ca.ET.210.01.1.1]TGQ65890.1 hypothetical protein EN855_028000 [Mesorhizobium sp. M1C.F.Ca.ET.212.01.1.1]TGQ99894.1 hypothetical protein EN847_27985 [Mesorhizobium sp. M1C.F.Ca.ET.204.01.1.1]TGR20428.1 hypothetical protein EN839_27985 [Mesorhizobium sp. M1C.F.Ca.ET.196.01.1.1]